MPLPHDKFCGFVFPGVDLLWLEDEALPFWPHRSAHWENAWLYKLFQMHLCPTLRWIQMTF